MLSQENDFTTYRNDTLGVLTQYPSDWDLLSNIPFFDFGFFVAESAGLGVKIVQVPPPIDLDQIYATTYALLPFIIPKYQLISTGETTFIDNPAFYITFEGHLKPVYSEEYGRDIKVQTIFTVIDDKLYGIAYFGFKPVFEDYRPAAQSMIDSFGLTLENSFFAIRINGKNMNFGWLDKIPFGEYLRSSGADITADCFIAYPSDLWAEPPVGHEQPDDQEYCIDDQNKLRVFIGYDELESPEAIKEYVPKENDRILISYGNQTSNELSLELDALHEVP